MKIKDLPKPIRKLAKRNLQKQHGFWKRFENFIYGWELPLKRAFVWRNTVEGYVYWYQVDNGNFTYEPLKSKRQ